MKRRTANLLGVLLLSMIIAPAAPAGPAAPATQAATSQPYQHEYEWYARNTVQAYERSGRHDPHWDAAARDMLEAYARVNANELGPTNDSDDTILHASAITRKAMCDDPLVLYVTGRSMVEWHRAPADIAEASQRAADAMKASAYHPFFRCYALIRAAEAQARAHDNVAAALQAARARMDEAIEQVPAVLDDPTVPRTSIFALISDIGEASVAVTNDREVYAARAAKVLDEKCKDRSLVLAVTARFHQHHAWDARGLGFADKVSDADAQVMQQRLELAAAAGETAFEIDPKNICGPLTMLTVELGQGQGIKRMETWFARAMDADPNCYKACAAKLYYLEPKWYGSTEQMIAFGRELLKQGNWNAGLPIILVEAHLDASRYTPDGYQPKPQPAYFADNPRVWEDVKAVYQPYLERFPNSLYHRSRYAQIAAWAGKWDEADRQLRAMGDKFSFTYFRTRTVYQRVRAEVEAKLHAP